MLDISSAEAFVARLTAQKMQEMIEKEEERRRQDESIFLSKPETEKLLGSRAILKAMEDRKEIFPYQFGVKEVEYEDGSVGKEPQGRVYYKRSEVYLAIERANILKSLRN